jgi:hypothetical protein
MFIRVGRDVASKSCTLKSPGEHRDRAKYRTKRGEADGIARIDQAADSGLGDELHE